MGPGCIPSPSPLWCREAGHISALEGERVDPETEQGQTLGREGNRREHKAAVDTVAVALS